MAPPLRGLAAVLEIHELDELPATITEKLDRHFKQQEDSFEEIKIQNEKLRVNSEQQCFELEKQLIDTQSQMESATNRAVEFENKVVTLDSQVSTLQSSLHELQNAHNNCANEQATSLRSIEHLELEKNDLLELLEKRSEEIEKLSEKCKELTEQMAEAHKKHLETQITAEEMESQQLSLQYREQRLEQERELVNCQTKLMEKELTERIQELATLRREHSSNSLELRTQLDERTEELQLTRENLASVKTSLEQQMNKNEGVVQKLKDARDAQAHMEEHFQQQVRAQTKLAELYKSSAEDNERRIAEMNTAVEELQKVIQRMGDEFQHREDELVSEGEKIREALTEVNSKLSNQQKELDDANRLLESLRPKGLSPEKLSELYPSAAATSHLLKSGMTLTQIYSEYTNVLEQLQIERHENEQLHQHLDHILREIEDKAPLLQRQREDYEKALDTIGKLTQQLDGAMTEYERMKLEHDDARRRSGQMDREAGRLKQQNSDLNQQVCFLTKEIQQLRGGYVQAPSENDETTNGTSSDVISQKLVTFRNIEELQEKNQQLLTVVRELSEKQEAEEREIADNRNTELQKALDSALEELEELRATRAKQADMLDSVVRQKEMYKVLLSSNTSLEPPLTSTPASFTTPTAAGLTPSPKKVVDESLLNESRLALKELKVEFDQYRSEKASNDKYTAEQLEKLRDQTAEYRLQNAKLASQMEHSSERFKILQTNVEGYKREIVALMEKNQRMSANMHSQEKSLTTLRDELLSVQEKFAVAEIEARNLRAERDLLKSVETRLLEEKELLQREQHKQNMLLTNLQAIQNTLERTESEMKIRFTSQLEMKEKECVNLRRKLDSEIEHYKTSVKAWEKEVSDLRRKLDSDSKKQQQGRDELVDAYAQVHSLKQELSQTQAKLVAAESRLSRTSETPVVAKGSVAKSSVKVDKEPNTADLKIQLTDAQGEIKALKDQLNQARQHLEQYKAITNSVELQLKSEIQTSQDFKITIEKRLQENLEQQSRLEKTILELEKEKQTLLQENQRLSSEILNNNSDGNKELSSLRLDLQNALQTAEEMKIMQEEARKDCQEQADLARESQDKYERELILHAADVQALVSVKEQLEGYDGKLLGAEEASRVAEQTLANSQASWDEQQKVLASEVQTLTDQVKQLQTHNSNLHDQMERMSSQMITLQNRGSQESVNLTLSEDATKSSEQLLEVIRYLRRDKDIAVTRSEVTSSENLRLKTQIEFLDKQVEELQKAVKADSQKSDVAMTTAVQHSDLLRKVEMLNVLTDSNKMLREERDSLLRQCREMEAKLLLLEKEISPLQEKSREAISQSEAAKAENQVLRNEVKRLQTRANQLMEQHSRTSPEELKRAIQERDNLRKQLVQITEDNQHLKADISKLNLHLTSVQNDLATVKANAQKKEKELDRLTEELGAKDAQLFEANKTTLQVKKIARTYKSQFLELKAQHDALKSKSNTQTTESAVAAAELAATQEASRQEIENKLKETEEKLKMAMEQTQKANEEVTALKKTEEQLKGDAATKDERAKKVLQSARQKINQLTSQSGNLAKELDDIKKKVAATEQAHEEANLRLSTIKSQLEGRIGRLERELKEAQDSKDAATQALAQEKERLQSEAEEMSAKMSQLEKQLEVQQKQFIHHQTAKVTAAPTLIASATTESRTANIRPMTTPSPTATLRHPHPHIVTPTPTGALSRTTPTASIRPMAIPQSRMVAVQPTTACPSVPTDVHDAIHSPPIIVPQAAVAPTPASTPVTVTVSPTTTTDQTTCTVAPVTPLEESTTVTTESGERPISSETEDDVGPPTTSTTAPAPMVAVSPMVEVHTGAEIVTQADVEEIAEAPNSPEPSTSQTVPVVGDSALIGSHAKRSHEEIDSDAKVPAEESPPLSKRSRCSPSPVSPQPPIQSSEVIDNSRISDTQIVEEIAVEPVRRQEDVTTRQMPPSPPVHDDDVIVVESDDDDQVEDIMRISAPHDSEDDNDEEQDDDEEEDEDDDEEEDVMEGDFGHSGQDETEEHMRDVDFQEIGEVMEDDQFDDVPEEMAEHPPDDDDVVEIIDDDDDEDNQMEAQDDGNSRNAADIPEPHESTNMPISSSTGSDSRSRLPFLPRIPVRTERLPSLGRQQLTPFMQLGTGGNFDEGDDSIVPSTPTLFLPRRNDGFAEAVSSPHISQGRFVFGAAPEMVVPTSQPGMSQLASQGGVDDTRMDLSQFDEGSGQSVPTTPLQVSPPAETTTSEMSSELPAQGSSHSPSPVTVPELSRSQDIPSITVTSDNNNTASVQDLTEDGIISLEVESVPLIEEPIEINAPEEEGESSEELPVPTAAEEAEVQEEVKDEETVPVDDPETRDKPGDQSTSQSDAEATPIPQAQRRPTPIVWSDPNSQDDRSAGSNVRGRGRLIRTTASPESTRGSSHRPAQPLLGAPLQGGVQPHRGTPPSRLSAPRGGTPSRGTAIRGVPFRGTVPVPRGHRGMGRVMSRNRARRGRPF